MTQAAATPLTKLPAWKSLETHYKQIQPLQLRNLFAQDPQRGQRLTADVLGIYFDYSKNRVTDETIKLLLQLAEQSGLRQRIEAMFRGEKINITEDRAVLHVALRAPRGASIVVDGENVVPQVHAVLDKMAKFADRIRSGDWRGHSGKPIRNVINIGIGGSDLGPVMAYEALRHYSRRDMTFRFVSNVDGTDFVEATRDLDAAETLFIISSKTFTTLETMTNAHSARAVAAGFVERRRRGGQAFCRRFDQRGGSVEIRHRHGQYVWILGLGRRAVFDGLGDRAFHDAGDRPRQFPRRCSTAFIKWTSIFAPTPLERNLPALLGLFTVWYTDFFGAQTVAVLPYEQYLKRFPAYLQQLTMESNGKHVTLAGAVVDYQTSPIYWGEPGTNGQHSFYQLIHQGTKLIPCDFLAFCESLNPLGPHHDLLVANVFAQAEALAFGKTASEVRAEGVPDWLVPHRTFEGNRPSNVFLLGRLDPTALGKLIALYEHSVFTQGTIWQIDSFDQWGVELGKVLAKCVAAELQSSDEPKLSHDSSTNALIQRYRKLKSTR